MARRSIPLLRRLLAPSPTPSPSTPLAGAASRRTVTYMLRPGDGAPRGVTLILGDGIRPLVTGAVRQVMEAMHAPVYSTVPAEVIESIFFWPDDRPFGKFGRLKDIYLPRDYYTREPKGFGFIQYFDPEDASDAKYHMDGQILLGREITIVFAEENRKKPSDMRARERMSGRGRSYNRRLRSRSPGYSDSPRGRSRSRSPSYSPAPKRKHYSRSPSPRPRERVPGIGSSHCRERCQV